jgi:ubiquinone/menaquinone biosynthesis C-methylase UbiE
MSSLNFNKNLAQKYLLAAPASLARERILECQLYQSQIFQRPVLDVGCGDGLLASILFVDQVDTGIDPNPSEIAVAESRKVYKELLRCFGSAIPKGDNTYKTAFSNSVLEHIKVIQPVLKEVFRVLEPGGVFYITIPTDQFEQYALVSRILAKLGFNKLQLVFRRWYNNFWKHYHCYSPEEWEAMLRQAGFRVIKKTEFAGKNTCTFNDILILSAIPALFFKSMFGRWVLFPKLRKIYMPALEKLFCLFLKDVEPGKKGGLIFFALRKELIFPISVDG